MTRREHRDRGNDLLDLNMWWNLNRLRDFLKKPGGLIRLLGVRPEDPELVNPRS